MNREIAVLGYDGFVPPRKGNPEVTRAFGRAVLVARVRLNLRRSQVAQRAGITAMTLGRIERGEREPTLSVLMDIAAAVQMSAPELLIAAEEELARRPMAGPARAPSVAACYIVRDGCLLMVRRRFKQGTLEWAGPSGNIKPGESPEEAAVREVREEVGIEVEVIERLGERVHPATNRHLIYLACRVLSGEATVVDHEEIAAVEWVPVPEALERWAGLKGGVFPAVRKYLLRVGAGEEGR